MAEDDNKSITPEKQLLRLIESPKKDEETRTAGVKREGKKWFSLGALRGRLSFLKTSSTE